ncbi:PEP-CTERM sorting domain-containing protein [Methylomonas sp. SURF-2]|uniref:PEP-CTERM sorting domain-containing protein n=1 Tax=Methylomonas subterranea TaxID=2952225 RepID=A0ABT1TE77_9GAMM|nr:PEP-CTERM sorting domain-containing protein [Methylomonas sp. SURF-2]MCQ8103760.1 PEP-CTERM sorting domain-containing protein [Methylomonas sp. SURF-2]
MKSKLLIMSASLIGLLCINPAAQAAWSWTGTLSDWFSAPVTDGDNDMQFTLTSWSNDLNPSNVDVTLEETEIANTDYYLVGFDFSRIEGYSGSAGFISYVLDVISGNEQITSARLDSVVQGGIGEVVNKTLIDNATGLDFLTLSSLNGVPDPLAGHVDFAGRTSITVADAFSANGGIISHIDNEFNMTIPEPMSFSLLGLGFGLMSLFRRKEQAVGA